MPESLENQFISDLYTSLLHLSGAELGPVGPLNNIFDGAGNSTGLALSGERVLINNYIYPRGFETRDPLEWLDCFFPVGCLQLTFDDNNPTDRIAGTTWIQVAKGRFLVGVGKHIDKNGTERDFCPGGEEEEGAGLRGGSGDIRGEYEVTLTEDQIPAHTHDIDIGAVDVQIPNPAGTGVTEHVAPVGTTNATISFVEQERARFELYQVLVSGTWTYLFGIRTNIFLNADDSTFFSGDSPFGNLQTRNDPQWIQRLLFDDPNLSFAERTALRSSNIDARVPPLRWENSRQNWPERAWLYALDFGFERGSAAGWSQEDRNPYIVGDLADTYQFKEMIGLWNGETRFVSDVNVRLTIGFHSDRSGTGVWRSAKTPYEYAKDLGAIDIGDAQDGAFEESSEETPIISGNTQVLERQEGANNTRTSAATGKNQAHNNILPSYGVYVWKRIS